MPHDASLTIRLPAALKRALEKAAASDMRSVSQLCVIVLSRHLGLTSEWRDGRRAAARRNRKRARPARP
ncbi:MAG: hypothetical protein KA297_00525 [Kofleriaceae bacterium]|nr:hypothetical protein [Kofleriaceae bacterium]